MRSRILLITAFVVSLAAPSLAQCIEEDQAAKKPEPVASVEKPAQPATGTQGG